MYNIKNISTSTNRIIASCVKQIKIANDIYKIKYLKANSTSADNPRVLFLP